MPSTQTRTVHEMFEKQVERTPDKIAVVYQQESLTYTELNRRSNRLAHELRHAGVKPNDIVALVMKRSADIMVGMMAILKAGGCYLPIDPSFPPDRIRYMLENSQASVMVTQKELRSFLDFRGQIFCVEDIADSQSDQNLEPVNAPGDLIYVLYTSGSTGKPKGVMVEHKAVQNFIEGVTRLIDFSEQKTIVSLTTISFDIFVLETLLPFCKGNRVVLADPMYMMRDIGQHRIDMIQTTPSTMQMLLNDQANRDVIERMSDIMLGGESFPKSLLHKLRALTQANIYNMYGPTETTVWSAINNLTLAQTITIGHPIANTELFIVDEQMQAAAEGEVGELCISGLGVARGYLHNQELTDQRFIRSSLCPGQMMYRTGDMARRLANGEVEFLGRVDNQIKVRGFRIEMGEIEECLSRHPLLQECVVAAKTNEWDEKYLVVYYVCGHDVPAAEIIAYLAEQLPEYMIPGFYVRVPQIPLTPNGKIDRNALPEPDQKRPVLSTDFILPKTELESKMAELWRQVLNREVGTQDNFFELGGNSVLLSMLAVRINDYIPDRIGITDIFSNPTVEKLAQLLQKRMGNQDEWKGLVFPSDYYLPEASEASEMVLEVSVNSATKSRLQEMARSNQAELPALLLTVYAHLLSEISNEERIGIAALAGTPSRRIRVEVDFKTTTEFTEILKQVELQINQASGLVDPVPVKEVGRFVVPSFVFAYPGTKTGSINSRLKLQIVEDQEELTCQIHFRPRDFAVSKMREFLNYYSQLVTAVAQSI
ncbi:amino acid adenylation domain-containing protein [Paenibacillus sp. FJAT-26967]|uniref:non-ribosomal peptide synthetase n=1 Tax=Paenibacillus sp. FJAT-26967 TaxID=1729690 RepID=UPI000B0891E2|nr:non-ribosomal peptide synthetase [Paenibacillus sp. FJAT-26967]